MLEFNSINLRTWSRLGQRGTFFGIAIFDVAQQFDNLIVTTADLGYLSGLERFMNTHPEKFLNIGIAEQNMLGISAGMAQEGKLVFATTYATFITMRSCEQLRHYLGYMKSNVKVVGTGAGLIMTWSGNTHYSIEDISITRSIPNMVVLSPADPAEAYKVALAAAKYDGPVYIRLTGGLNQPQVYKNDYNFEIGKAVQMTEDGEVTIFATGSMVYNSIKAAEMLKEKGLQAGVVNIHTIKPIDKECITNKCNSSKLLVVAEEHSKIGGLGGAIAEHLSSLSKRPPLLRMGIKDQFQHAGDYNYLLGINRLMPEQIADDILKAYQSHFS
ncbi:MAG TPA: transketolase C-terminal domain-containing protein [Prolixibacteraceae bacterium]|nr:transketolase C-terminal domain-containing protein [Prolixibacteraceae bacterium]HPL45542.1 transketolase C-terminal domain-containing protein [Prolixibacteraceae bacterium]HQJ85799.1 transketolase C-terminal domain-containing protein [Prolixibacteraceae bacterium]